MAFGRKLNHASGKVPELGAIFMSSCVTKKLCFSWKTFGLSSSEAGFVKKVKAGMFLFLFDYEKRVLYGVYQACSDGTMNLSSKAFSSAGNRDPAQVQFRVIWYCKPLSEDDFRPAIKDNYFEPYKFNFGLSRRQVWELLWLFSSRKLRDELRPDILPSDPSPIHGANRSCIIDDGGERYACRERSEHLPENANARELHNDPENFLMPHRELHNRLLMYSDKETILEDTAIPSLSYIRESSDRDKVTQVRDIMDHGCNSDNELKISSGISGSPFVIGDERFRINMGSLDADIQVHNMPSIGRLQRMHYDDSSMCDERAYADHNVNGRSLNKEDEVRISDGQNHVISGRHHLAFGSSSLNPLSYYGSSVPGIGNAMAIDELRKPSLTCYSEPIISNSKSPCPLYCDISLDERPSSYDPGSGTSLQGLGRYREVHHSPNSFGGSHRSTDSELPKYLSKKIPFPCETDAEILREPVAQQSGTINHPISSRYSQSRREIESLGIKDYEDDLLKSWACGRTDEKGTTGPPVCKNHIRGRIYEDYKAYQERQHISQNKRSVFSRLKPALDADNMNGVDSKGLDAQDDIDTMVNEVMEMLRGHYCGLRQMDDDDNSKIEKHQTLQSQRANNEQAVSKKRVFDVSIANEQCETQSERDTNGEMPHVISFKRRSEVQKTRNAVEGDPSEKSCTTLSEKQCKRRKLVRPSFSNKKLSNKDAVLDKISTDISLLCPSFQDGSCNTDLPLPCDKEENPTEAGSSGALAASVGGECSNGQSRSSNNLTDRRAEICKASEDQKHEGQTLYNPSSCDIQQKLTHLRSAVAVLTASVGGVKHRGQLTLNRLEDEGGETCITFSGDHRKDEKTTLNDTNFGLIPKSDGDREMEILKRKEMGGSLKDAKFPVDERAETCTMIINGNKKIDGKAMLNNMNVGLENDNDDDEGMPIITELGRSPNDADLHVDVGVDGHKQQSVSVTEAGDARSEKSVELGGNQRELPNYLDINTMSLLPENSSNADKDSERFNLSETQMNNRLLA